MLSQSNFNILQYFEFLSLALNFFLCLDIVLTMRNPFYPHDRRMKSYLPWSILLACFAFSVSLKRISLDHDEANDSQNMKERALFSVGFLTIYIIFAVVSVAYVYRINTRDGMSSDVRKEFVQRHLLYVSAYILTWLPYLGFSYFILYTTTVVDPDVTYADILTINECKFAKSLK